MKLAIRPMPVARPLPLRKGSLNRARHTRRNRWLIGVLLGCVALMFLTHCANRVPEVPPRAKITPAAQQKSASPTLVQARKLDADADIRNAHASAKIDSAKSGLASSHSEIKSLVSEVGRLRQQKAASENELLDLYNRLLNQERKFSVMVQDLVSAEASLEAERALRRQSDSAVVAAEAMVHAKDAEAAQLRAQLIHSELVADTFETASRKNSELAHKAAARADAAAGKISILWRFLIGVSAVCFISIIVNIIQLRGRFPL